MAPWKKIGLTTDQLEDALEKILPSCVFQVVAANNLPKAMKTTAYPKAIICNIDPDTMRGRY